MRVLVVGLAALLAPVQGEPPVGDTCASLGGVVVKCHASERGDRPEESGPAKQAPSPNDVLYWPDLVLRDGVGFCVTFTRDVFPGAARSARAVEAEARMLRMFASYSVCPGVERPPPGPAAIAREVIEQFLPTPPRPRIAPGYAITGKPAYLETNGNLRPTREQRTTDLGPIAVEFRGRYHVDWGDGSPVESFEREGVAWPDGQITHTYTRAGLYDVVVRVEWIADWTIGALNGRIDRGLQTTSTIDGFEVRQLQAVRDR